MSTTTTRPITMRDLTGFIHREAPKDGSVKEITPENPLINTGFGLSKLQAFVSNDKDSLGRLRVILSTVTGSHVTAFNSGEYEGDSGFGFSLTSKNRDVLCQRKDGAFEPLTGTFRSYSGNNDFTLPTSVQVRDNLEVTVNKDTFDPADLINFRFGVASEYELIQKFLETKL